ncbi:hypothetical protein DFH28DRAFT_911975 [Melampsora americana]|nr:hypothetical protein DFH28DRAFT_911975 [Melampsora americana]
MKEILQTYLTAEDEGGVIKLSRRYWGGRKGQQSTLTVLASIKKLVCKKPNGRKFWRMFILQEAKDIVDMEASRRWRSHYYPPHVSAKAVKASLFTLKTSDQRSQQMRDGMSFLYQLIRHRLSFGRPQTRPDFADLTDEPKGNARHVNRFPRHSEDESSEEDDVGLARSNDAMDEDAISPLSSSSERGHPDFNTPQSSQAGDESDAEVEYGSIDVDGLLNNTSVNEKDDQTSQASEIGDEDDWIDAIEGVIYVRPGERNEQLKLRFDTVGHSTSHQLNQPNA